MTEWISTKHAMSLLGVGSTTIKRWADEGRIPYYKTAGGHRRFRRGAIERLAEGGDSASGNTGADLSRSMELLLRGDVVDVAQGLRDELTRGTDPFELADRLAEVVQAIGQIWASGNCSTIDELLAATRASQAVTALAVEAAPAASAPAALVATATGERHSLGATLAQFCLRTRGIAAELLDCEVLPEQLNEHLRGSGVRILTVCASAAQNDEIALKRYVRTVGRVCDELNIRFIVGGQAEWPVAPGNGHRCINFRDFRALLDSKAWLH